jgi:hypothetical protein
MWRNCRSYHLFLLLILCSLLYVSGCSGNSPKIITLDTRLERVYDQKRWKEELRLFLLITDEDGPEDIEEIDIAFDRQELLWKITGEDIVTVQKDGEIWMGHPAVSMPGGGVFPDGSYRVILIDQLGKSSESSFRIGVGSGGVKSEPDIVISHERDGEGGIIFPDRGEWEELRWVVYDQEAAVLETREAVMDENGRVPIPDESTGRYLQLFGFNSSEKIHYRIKIR